MELLEELAKRVEYTYHARRQMARRLQQRAVMWNAALVSLSTSTTIVAIPAIAKPSQYGPQSASIFACSGVLVLIASLLVTGADYKEKSRAAFENYRALQRLSVQIYAASHQRHLRRLESERLYAEFDREYQAQLDRSENHSASDWATALTPRLEKSITKKKPLKSNEREVNRRGLWANRFRRTTRSFATGVPIMLCIVAALFTIPALWGMTPWS